MANQVIGYSIILRNLTAKGSVSATDIIGISDANGNLLFKTTIQKLVQNSGVSFTGNIAGLANTDTAPATGATPESQVIYLAGPGTYTNFPDGADPAEPIVLTENLNIISWDGTKATVQAVPVNPDLSGYVEKTDIINNISTDDSEKALSATKGLQINKKLTNPLLNGYFTEGLDSWVVESGTPQISISGSPTAERGQFYATASATGSVMYQDFLPGNNITNLKLSFQYSGNNTLVASLAFYDGSDTEIRTDTLNGPLPPSGVWIKKVLDVSLPPSTVRIRVKFERNSGANLAAVSVDLYNAGDNSFANGVLQVNKNDTEQAVTAFDDTATNNASLSTNYYYSPVDYTDIAGKFITKVRINCSTAGSFSVFAIPISEREPNNATPKVRLLTVLSLQTGINYYDINAQLGIDETIAFGAPTDTAIFIYAPNTNTDPFKTFMSFKVSESGFRVSGAVNAINIEVWTKDVKSSLDIPYDNARKLRGKKLAIIGTSIDTYDGWIKSGNATWYPQEDVNNVIFTWWFRMVQRTGAKLILNDSWSGSRVAEDAHAGSLIDRLGDLPVDTDICLIPMGVNDWLNAIPPGTPTYTDPFDQTTFAGAIGYSLKSLMTNYPNTHFIWIVPGHLGNNGIPELRNGHRLKQYCDIIREMCEVYGVGVIDLQYDGIGYHNAVEFIQGKAVHPNVPGHARIDYYASSKLLTFNF